jgi:hypothetical protein
VSLETDMQFSHTESIFFSFLSLGEDFFLWGAGASVTTSIYAIRESIALGHDKRFDSDCVIIWGIVIGCET